MKGVHGPTPLLFDRQTWEPERPRGRGQFCWDNPTSREGFDHNILTSWDVDCRQSGPLVPLVRLGAPWWLTYTMTMALLERTRMACPIICTRKCWEALHFQALRWIERCFWRQTPAIEQENMGVSRSTERATERVTGLSKGGGSFCCDNPTPKRGIGRNILPSWDVHRQQSGTLLPPGG